ncbi:hypothetical protein [Coxiella endosymbiont of Rhipicephalus microplus]|uniref:hypothetical protein n=1 Tax=Coxiella endosymbiont of Rhipicephalus microplus TaxID=1656186 RepID=UPI000CE5BC26|nr:hypothetical protein [Coxiella endosymbiont of Rhipicephalus microplus]
MGEFFCDAAFDDLKKHKLRNQFVLVDSIDAANPAVISDVQLIQYEKEGLIEYSGKRTDMSQIIREKHMIYLPFYPSRRFLLCSYKSGCKWMFYS